MAAISCKKTDNSATATVTTDQVADITTGSLALSTTGLSTNFADITVSAESVSSLNGPAKTINAASPGLPGPQCGITLTDSTVKTGTSNHVTFGYYLKYTHTLNCNSDSQADNLSYNLAFHGYYNGPNITAIDTGSSAFLIGGFTSGSTVFSMNGTYHRKGAFTSKIGDKVSGTSDLTIVVTNLIVTKSTRKIAGGSATITITVTTHKGHVTYHGALTFNADDTATLTVNGVNYSINLITGVKIKH